MALCYYNGLGVTKNKAEAFKWFKKSAEQGYATAQYNLGSCYNNGWGVVKSQAEAVKWYQKAARGDDAEIRRKAEDALKSLRR